MPIFGRILTMVVTAAAIAFVTFNVGYAAGKYIFFPSLKSYHAPIPAPD